MLNCWTNYFKRQTVVTQETTLPHPIITDWILKELPNSWDGWGVFGSARLLESGSERTAQRNRKHWSSFSSRYQDLPDQFVPLPLNLIRSERWRSILSNFTCRIMRWAIILQQKKTDGQSGQWLKQWLPILWMELINVSSRCSAAKIQWTLKRITAVYLILC